MGTQSEQIEQQARRVRARTSETVQALRARLTPGQLTDQVADYAREGPAAEFVRNLGREACENPLPLVLIAIGVAWLMVAGNRSYRNRMERDIAERATAGVRRAEVTPTTVVDEGPPIAQPGEAVVCVVSPAGGKGIEKAPLYPSRVMETSQED